MTQLTENIFRLLIWPNMIVENKENMLTQSDPISFIL